MTNLTATNMEQMAVTGHRSEAGLRSYQKIHPDKKMEICNRLNETVELTRQSTQTIKKRRVLMDDTNKGEAVLFEQESSQTVFISSQPRVLFNDCIFELPANAMSKIPTKNTTFKGCTFRLTE